MPSTMVQVPILHEPGQNAGWHKKRKPPISPWQNCFAKGASGTFQPMIRRPGSHGQASHPGDKETIRAIDKTLALVAESEARMLALSKTRKKGTMDSPNACGCLRQHHQAERQGGATQHHGRQAAVAY